MKLIVGLGNPGKKYESTRHNVGYLVVDGLRSKFKSKFKNMVVAKTGVFMNDSGGAVKKLTTNYQLPTTNLYVVHDDLDIPLGKFKIQFGKGPKDHNGIKSIDRTLETCDYWRIRVGIENRDSQNRVAGEEYTLQDFLPGEKEVINKVILEIAKWLISQN